MNFSNMFNKYILPLAVASLATVFSACKEGKHDYFYCATNETDKDVCLAYKVVGDNETYYDTLKPGQTDTLSHRGNVSGDDIWDIETSAEIYQITQLEASINDSIFTDNMRLRKLWGPVIDSKNEGSYNLKIKKDAFVFKNVIYFYNVINSTQAIYDAWILAPVNFPNDVSHITLWPGQSAYLFNAAWIKERRPYVDNLYKDATATTRISHYQLANTSWLDLSGQQFFPRNFNPHRAMDWTFEPQVIAGDSVGIFTLEITPEMIQ